MSSILFTAWGYEVSILEFVAALTSLSAVILGTTKRRITWPWWALSSVLYGVFFYQVDLFASAVLQIIFVIAAIYGWFGWAPTGAVPGNVSGRGRLIIAIVTILSVAFLAPVLSEIGAAATWTDAFVLIGSLTAQLMMIYEKFETWIVWVIVDVVATVQYLLLGYYFTALLYGIFTVVAVVGWKRWHDSLSH
jgi:nicotinamide mononucleotide transporter